jgi:SAM-dependent methyltransferase
MAEVGGTVSFKELERQNWAAKAAAYDAWLGPVTAGAIEPLLDATEVDRGMHVLDVACGPGYGAAQATSRGARAIGIDFAAAMVAEARRRFPGIAFREGDAENLDFADGEFDGVFCALGLHHMAAPDRAIAEAYRVLKPGGRYAFTVWAAPDRHDFFRLVLGAIQAHGRTDVPLPPAPPMFRFSDAEESRRILTGTGFHDVSVREVSLVWQAASPDAIVDMVHKSTVRAALLVEHQTPDARERIHAAIIDGAAQFRRDGAYTMAFPAVLSAARKP